jgi:hypothetical protein
MNYTEYRAITIDFWEYAALILFIGFVGFMFARQKNLMLHRHPEYRYYLWGLYAKIIGGFFFTMTYIYYYGNGDTVSFFKSSVALSNLWRENPVKYVEALFGDNSVENLYRLFSPSTGYPLGYVYVDDRTYMLVRIISPLTIIGLNSVLITGAMVSVISYGGVWRLYRTLLRYYPKLQRSLAIAVLFFPSAVFWGSGIMKDTFTFTAVCWFIYALDRIFFQKEGELGVWIQLFGASLIMVLLKPYIFMLILPSSLLWVLYQRVQRLRNAVLRVLLLPAGMLFMAGLSFVVLEQLEGSLGKFSLGKALNTVVVTQLDMKRSDQYGMNYFDLGNIEATWTSILSKFPQAVFAGLYRPSLIEVNNIVMLITALENTFLLGLSIYILLRSRLVFFITLVLKNPLLQMCYIFAISYAFMIAITTPNFGAMVRFKIPMLPLFVSGLYITSHILDRRRKVISLGKKFRFDSFSNGDPDRPVGSGTRTTMLTRANLRK